MCLWERVSQQSTDVSFVLKTDFSLRGVPVAGQGVDLRDY